MAAAASESSMKVDITETWLRKHRFSYIGATRHPFILTIHDGSLHFNNFKRWLAQDYIFVRAFVPFLASVLLKASKESDDDADVDVILGGVASLNDEIAWFKNESSKWNVSLASIVPQKANQEYCRFLESLSAPDVSYTVAVTAFWAIEAVYYDSYSHCLDDDSRTPKELRETCKRWGNDDFGRYCESLKSIATRRLSKGSKDVISKAETVFLRVLELEIDFWSMSNGET